MTDLPARLEAKLYLLPTPIGNLGDITLRSLDILRGVDRLFCEDTRSTLRLLNALGIKKPLESCHEHNELLRSERIAELVRGGEAVAFVSDAGMPGISDPGGLLVRHFINEGLPFAVLPGASALPTAWITSGLGGKGLVFTGFLPRSGAERTENLARFVRSELTAVIYESPLRVGATLADIRGAIEVRGGDASLRPCALVRELTKLHEECVRGSVASLAERYAAEAPRGECVIVLGGAENTSSEDEAAERAEKLLFALVSEGLSAKTAARITCDTLGFAKNAAYKIAAELKEKLGK